MPPLDIAKMPGGPAGMPSGPKAPTLLPKPTVNIGGATPPLDVTKTATFHAPASAAPLGNVIGARKIMSLGQNKLGLTKAGSAALVGNFDVESAGIHPGQQQFGGGPGHGLAQWGGSRLTNLGTYAAAHGGKENTIGTQMGFVGQELKTDYPSLYHELQTTHNAAQATSDVEQQYEAPADPAASIAERTHDAQIAAGTNWGLNSGGKAGPQPGIQSPSQGRGSHLVTTYKEEPTEVPTTAADRAQYSQKVARDTVAQFGATDFTANFVRSMEANPPPQMKAAQIKIGTTSRVPNPAQAGNLVQAANAAKQGRAGNAADPLWNTVLKSANYINSKQMNYEWGGGHNASFAPTHGSGHGSGSGVGYDCSGVLSRVLHTAGLLSTPLVSGQMADLGRYVPQAKPGAAPANDPHAITIYANSVHTFAKIGNQYFGTSDEFNPGGGAGWMGGQAHGQTELNYLSSLGGYQTWHISL